MKIAFFMVPLLNHGGGAEKYFINIANEMARRGHETSIINLDKSLYSKLTFFLSIYYHHKLIKLRYTDKEIEKELKEVKWIKTNLRNLKNVLNNFDVIYAKNEILDLSILKLIGMKNLPPVIVGVHTPIFYPISDSFYSKLHNFLYLGPLYRWLLGGCQAIHIPNSDYIKLIKDSFPDFKNKTFLIFYPFDSEAFSSLETNENDNLFRILFVGRLTEQKGIDILVRVIERISLTEEFKNMYFNIAGSGELQNDIKYLQQKFSNVNWLGHVPQSEIPKIYISNDILIAPSRYEMLPWVPLEAQSCGVPVIVSDIAGPRDIIIDGKTGFLVKYNVEAFVDKILYFYNLKKDNPDKFNKFRIKAREHIKEKFEPAKICNQLEDMFEELSNAKK